MLGVVLVQAGFGLVAAGVVTLTSWIGLGVTNGREAAVLVWLGLLAFVVGALLPARARRVPQTVMRLDDYAPVWQFRERHALRMDAAPDRAYDAIRAVRVGEIRFFGFLTWLRRGGRALPEGILHAPADAPILDVALRGGFLLLADDPPREVVVGMVVIGAAPASADDPRETYRTLSAPGFAKATMNFLVTPDAGRGSIVTTETRVYATSAGARRRFALYWRIIQPGSAFIRRMWLRAIRRRAEGPAITPLA